MQTVISKDGTRIAFEVGGSGPPLILVHGSTGSRKMWSEELRLGLEQRFSVYAMDRRGRGDSGDGEVYSFEREVEDVIAVANEVGPQINLFGHSFGALCSLAAAPELKSLHRLVIYEPPFCANRRLLYPIGTRARLEAFIDAGDYESALEGFYRTAAGVSDQGLTEMRSEPTWPIFVSVAHTAVREMTVEDYTFDAAKFAKLDIPVMLLVGSESPEELVDATRVVADALPNRRVKVLQGQGHVATITAPSLVLDALTSFLLD